MGLSGPPSNTWLLWFLRPTQVHDPSGTLISLTVFAGLTINRTGGLIEGQTMLAPSEQ